MEDANNSGPQNSYKYLIFTKAKDLNSPKVQFKTLDIL